MIKSLYKIHDNKTIAVVGSGPTAVDFLHSSADISIGVNGAAKLGKKFDYFMCGDVRSSSYDWFEVDCSRVRIIAKLTASLDKILYPLDIFPDIERAAVITTKQHTLNLPVPIEPHLTFVYKWHKPGRLQQDMNFLMFGGTISCCAVQLAYIMGASKIVLYGCNFTSRGKHYFYSTRRPGSISDSQRTVMNTVINEVKERGVQIQIIGETTLNPT
jgi:hypothetical protein